MRAFLFPGQGSQQVGMGADLFGSDPAFRGLVAQASQCAGTDLERLCLRGPDRELARTEFLQPLLVAVSLGYARQMAQRRLFPDVVLGHSSGEIAALAVAEVLSPEQAVAVAARRGQLMAAAAAASPGGMVAVTTDRRDALLALIRSGPLAETVSLANDNAPTQLVFSGPTERLEALTRLVARDKLGSCRRLAVSGPWHSPALSEAREQFAGWVGSVSFRPPKVPLLLNVSACLSNDPEAIRNEVIQDLTQPVRWRESMERLRQLKPTALFEVGPGRVLCGLARANGFGEEVRLVPVNNLRGVALAAP